MPIAQILTDHRSTFDQCANNSIWWYFHKLTSSTKRELYKSKMFSSCKMANNLFAANPCSFLLCLIWMKWYVKNAKMGDCCSDASENYVVAEKVKVRSREGSRVHSLFSVSHWLSSWPDIVNLFRIKSTLDCRSPRDKVFSSSSFLLSSPTPRGMF